ncbi:MAG: FHA domain-containing protein [Armatimonadota bacterium]
MLQMFIAGLIGGFLAWLINEPWTHDEPTSRDQITSIYIQSVIFFGIVGALVGAALGSVESLLTGAYMKMLRDGAIGLGLGALGGAAAGFIGQFAYASIGGGRSGIAIQIISRTIGWALAGMAIGLAQGARYMNFNRLLNGFIGGAVGGFVGGLLFDVIATVVGGAEISRLIALVVIGGATGAAIGLLEEVRKEAWLSIVDGPLTGKEFILYQQQTTIGSAGYCDIPLLKDPNVAPEHARIVMQGNAIRLENLLDPEAVLVNDQPVSQHALSNGDFIHIGSTVFQYNDRAVDAPHP